MYGKCCSSALRCDWENEFGRILVGKELVSLGSVLILSRFSGQCGKQVVRLSGALVGVQK
jgi:hypothetical protein